MQKFFYCYNSDCKEVNSTSVYSFDPYFIAIKKLLFLELRQITFYIQKIKELKVDMSIYIDKVIEFIYILIVNLDFKRENFFEIIQDLYKNKCDLKNQYKLLCNENNLEFKACDVNEIDLSSKSEILKLLNDIEKNIENKNLNLSENKKCLYNIMLALILDSCSLLIELKDYDVELQNEKDLVIDLINSTELNSIDDNLTLDKINDFSKSNYKLYKILQSKINEKYGFIQNSTVSTSVKKGKSILVSGTSFLDLEKILLATKDLNINVYTHSNLINAFSFKNFSKFPHLVGHYQPSKSNFTIDFSSFAGPIFISKNTVSEINVIRGHLYTNSKYPPFGFGKIIDDDFSPIISFAKESEGFTYSITNAPIEVGLSDKKLNSTLDSIIEKTKKGFLNKIIILGTSNSNEFDKSYIEKFVQIATKNNFIFSLSANYKKKNFLHINAFYDSSYLYKILERFKEENMNDKVNIILFDDTPNLISTLLNINYFKPKNIFYSPLCKNKFYPEFFKYLNQYYSLQELSIPNKDLKIM